MQTLGQHLREVREKRQISIRRLAKTIGVTAAYLSDIELGRRHPSEVVMASLAKALHTSIDDLHRHDPRSLINEIQIRVRNDPEYGWVLKRLLSKCTTTKDLLRIIEP